MYGGYAVSENTEALIGENHGSLERKLVTFGGRRAGAWPAHGPPRGVLGG